MTREEKINAIMKDFIEEFWMDSNARYWIKWKENKLKQASEEELDEELNYIDMSMEEFVCENG